MNTRTRLLTELKKNSGKYISGETLSCILGISRAAVSKHIAVLKVSGYSIDSSPKIGYRLSETTRLVLPDEIRDGLETKILGQADIVHYTLVDSTNDRAKALAIQGAPEGTIVVAEEQSAGRGRKGRSWLSANGDGICLSLILRPSMPPGEISQITLMTAVAIAETLLEISGADVNIKWPNDILVNGKKIAGILTEMSMEMDVIDYIIIGLGLNVNTEKKLFGEDIKDLATSLYIVTGIHFSRSEIIRLFLQRFEKYYLLVQSDGFSSIIKRWKELSNIIGKYVTVDISGRKISGTVDDIGEDGVMILKDEDDKKHRIISGDVLL